MVEKSYFKLGSLLNLANQNIRPTSFFFLFFFDRWKKKNSSPADNVKIACRLDVPTDKLQGRHGNNSKVTTAYRFRITHAILLAETRRRRGKNNGRKGLSRIVFERGGLDKHGTTVQTPKKKNWKFRQKQKVHHRIAEKAPPSPKKNCQIFFWFVNTLKRKLHTCANFSFPWWRTKVSQKTVDWNSSTHTQKEFISIWSRWSQDGGARQELRVTPWENLPER